MTQYVLLAQPDDKKILKFFVSPGKFWTFSYQETQEESLEKKIKIFLKAQKASFQVVKGFYEPLGDSGFLSLVILKDDFSSLSLTQLNFSELIKIVSPPRLRLVYLKALQILSEANPEGMQAYEIKR